MYGHQGMWIVWWVDVLYNLFAWNVREMVGALLRLHPLLKWHITIFFAVNTIFPIEHVLRDGNLHILCPPPLHNKLKHIGWRVWLGSVSHALCFARSWYLCRRRWAEWPRRDIVVILLWEAIARILAFELIFRFTVVPSLWARPLVGRASRMRRNIGWRAIGRWAFEQRLPCWVWDLQLRSFGRELAHWSWRPCTSNLSLLVTLTSISKLWPLWALFAATKLIRLSIPSANLGFYVWICVRLIQVLFL